MQILHTHMARTRAHMTPNRSFTHAIFGFTNARTGDRFQNYQFTPNFTCAQDGYISLPSWGSQNSARVHLFKKWLLHPCLLGQHNANKKATPPLPCCAPRPLWGPPKLCTGTEAKYSLPPPLERPISV